MKSQKSKSPVTKNSKSPPTFKSLSQPSTISSQNTAASSQKSRKQQEEQKVPAKSPKKSPSTSPKLKNLKISEEPETSKSPRLKLTGSAPPKKPMTGFIIFCNEKRETVRTDNPDVKITEITKILGQAWNALTDAQKEPYHQAATAEKVRYEQEMKQFSEKGFYINAKGQNSADLYQPKLSDDIVQPKKGLSSYIFFSLEESKKLRDKNPGIATTDV